MTKKDSGNTILKLAAIVNYFNKFSVDDLKEALNNSDATNLEISDTSNPDDVISAIYSDITKTGYSPASDWNLKYNAANN